MWLEAHLADAIAHYPVADPVEYRLGRIAEWSQDRYKLNERFVNLTLLVDQGEDAPAQRWKETEHLSGLRAVLDRAEPSYVVLGPPGSGKSTLLRRLELDLAVEGLCETGAPMTFFVPLSQYDPPASGGRRLVVDWLAERWLRRFPRLPDLRQLLADGRMIILADALNEMPHTDHETYRQAVSAWKRFLVDYCTSAPRNRVIFSCRSLDYSTPLSTPALRVPQLVVQPMGDEQVREFINAYHPAMCDQIWDRIGGSPQLEMLRTPYFLRLLVGQVRDARDIPSGHASLFTGFVRESLRREIETGNDLFAPGGLMAERDYRRAGSVRRWRTPFELPERGPLFRLVEKLAMGMQTAGLREGARQVRVGYDSAIDLIDSEEAESVVAAGLELGVLDEDLERDEVMFFHHLLQEYFAARHVARRPESAPVEVAWREGHADPELKNVIAGLDPGQGLPTLPRSGWEETMLLAAAMADDPATFVTSLAERNLALAGRCALQVEVAERLSPEVRRQLAASLKARTLDVSADLRDRIECGRLLGELGDPRLASRQSDRGTHVVPPFIEIPGGEYPIGDDQPILYEYSRTKGVARAHVPRHVVELAAFAIGVTPVTNAEWAHFVAGGGYDDPSWWTPAASEGWRSGRLVNEGAKENNREWWREFSADRELFERMAEEGRFPDEATVARWREWLKLDAEGLEAALETHWRPVRRTEPRLWADSRFNAPAQPVVGITWYEARAYCAWLSAMSGENIRLPTEVEWEAAARGVAARSYAWGDEFDPFLCNALDTHIRAPTPVGVFPGGATPEGALDMTGNVWEWTSSAIGPDPESPQFGYPYLPDDGREDPGGPPNVQRIVRGGSCADVSGYLSCANRVSNHPANWGYYSGLRLALSLD